MESGRTIQRRNTYELIAHDVMALVRDGTLKPGSAIATERELMQTYGVGRSSVREAIRVLESQGLIVADGRGSFTVADVATPLSRSFEVLLSVRPATMRDLYEVRRMLEVENAALAAARRSDTDLAEMAAAIEAQQLATETPGASAGVASTGDAVAADVRFHMAIAAASGNPLSLSIMQAIRGLMRRAQGEVVRIAGVPNLSLRQHRTVFAAIESRSPAKARAAMLKHLETVEQNSSAVLDQPALLFLDGNGKHRS